MYRSICILIVWGVLFLVYAKELSLEEALTLAKQNAVELQTLEAEQALASATHQRSAQAFLPKISADAAWLRADSSLLDNVTVPSSGLPPRMIRQDFGPEEGWVSGIQMIQPLFNMDALKARKQAARGIEARRRAYQWGDRLIRFKVVEYYYAVAVRQMDEKAARMALEAAQQACGLANAACQEGLVAKLDVLRADSEVKMRKARVAIAEADVKKAQLAFQTLLGLSPRESVSLNSDFPEPAPPETASSRSTERSDLLAWKARYAAAAAGLEKEQAGWLPIVNLLARQQWLDGDEPFDQQDDGWLVAVQLKWDLFDGLGRQGRIAEARARKELARIQVERAQRSVEQEQEQTLADWQAVWSALQASGQAMNAADEALTLARRQYEEGVGNMTDLLTVQSALYRRRLEYSRYQHNLLMAAMNHYLRHGMDPLKPFPERIQ